MNRRTTAAWLGIGLLIGACGGDDGSGSEATSVADTSATTPTTSDDATNTSPPTTSASTSDTGSSDDGLIFDVGQETESTSTTGPIDMCKVVDDMNAVGDCRMEAPANSFEPDFQWTWTDPNGEEFSIVTPLVANLTDDNDDGEIDLCDVPDVVVNTGIYAGGIENPGHIFILDGATGTLHFRIETTVDVTVTPAIGDIDNDGLPEIVAAALGGNLVGWDHDGTEKFNVPATWPPVDFYSGVYSAAFALADVDNDGDVEIISANFLADHNGNTLHNFPQLSGNWSATAAADLDGDDDLEIVLGHAAYHHDGSQYFVSNLDPGYPQIANLDADPDPEVLLTNRNGISMLEHNGVVKFQDQRPTGDPIGFTTWLRPATIHDFDGDGDPEFAMSSLSHYSLYEADASLVWMADVADFSGIAAGTAFDFLGDGVAEAMYADESFMFAFDAADGDVLLQVPRSSGTLTEYPVVADIDNDGSAEIVFTSNQFNMGMEPTVQVIRDIQDRWIQPRRIWNQHTYHVTNVREDSTIPMVEPHSWELLNTFRTNAQIEGGGICQPEPPG